MPGQPSEGDGAEEREHVKRRHPQDSHPASAALPVATWEISMVQGILESHYYTLSLCFQLKEWKQHSGFYIEQHF